MNSTSRINALVTQFPRDVIQGPLSFSLADFGIMDDLWIWVHDISGVYSAKSAYR